MRQVIGVLYLLLAIGAGALCAADTENLEEAVNALKAFEGKGDPAAIPMAQALHKAATEQLAQPKPEDEEEAQEWAEQQEYLKQVRSYAEFALMNQAAKATDPAAAVAAVEALIAANPQSAYLSQAGNAAFLQLRQANQLDRSVVLAERLLPLDPNNAEMLLVVADHYMKRNDSAKVLDYARRLVTLARNRAKPEELAPADWEARKATLVSAGLWMEGVTLATGNKFADANRTLREALPLLTDEQMKAAALFHLGVANFRLGESGRAPNLAQLQESLNFSAQCAAIKSPYSANCAKNALAVQQKYRLRAK